MSRNRDLLYGMILILVYVFLVLVVPERSHFDMSSFAAWSKGMTDSGLGWAYEMGTNYHPLYLYILRLFGLLYGAPESIDANIHLLKTVVLLFDFAAVYLVMRFLSQNNVEPVYAFLILFNVAYLYNTVVWGQIDTMHTFFAFTAFLAAFRKKTSLSAILFLLALNTKLQAVIFLPSLALLLVPQFISYRRKIAWTAIVLVLAQTSILLPFILKGQVGKFSAVIFGAVDWFPVVSMNAFNVWHLILSGDLMKTPDSIAFWGISYKKWGLGGFIFFSLLILFPVAARIITKFKHRALYEIGDYQLFFLSFSLIPLVFFYFNTQMHERYIHPAILFAGVYAILSQRYTAYALVSCGYVLNLEGVQQFLNIPHDLVIFKPWFISLLFLLSLVIGVAHLYRLSVFEAGVKGLRRSLRTSIHYDH